MVPVELCSYIHTGEPISNQSQQNVPYGSGQPRHPWLPGSVGVVNPQTGAKLGWTLWSCCAFILVAVGRVGELVPALATLPLAKIAIGSAMIGLIAEYRQLSPYTISASRIGRISASLLALSIVSVLFSVWGTNSLETVRDEVAVVAVSYMLIFKVATHWRAIEMLLKSLVLAAGVLAFAALYGYAGGRAEVASMYDTNDLAFVLVSVLPIVVGFAVTRSGMPRLVYLTIAASFVVTVLLTASRGGFLGLVAVIATLSVARLWPQSNRNRAARGIGIAVLLALFSLAAWVSIPQDAQERIASILHIESDYNLDPDESNGRLAIWKRNFSAGLHRPIGYGIGNFGIVDMMMGGQDRAPHNTLLEAFVELGALGLILLVRLYWVSLSQLAIAGRPAEPGEDAHDAVRSIFARCVRAALIGTLVSGFFLSMLKADLLWALFAIAATVVAHQATSHPIRGGHA